MKKQDLIAVIQNTPTFVASFRVTRTVSGSHGIRAFKHDIVTATGYVNTYRDSAGGLIDLPAGAVDFNGYVRV